MTSTPQGRTAEVVRLPVGNTKSAKPFRFSPRLDGVLAIQEGFGIPLPDLAAILRIPHESFVKWATGDDLTSNGDGGAPVSAIDRRIDILSRYAKWWSKNSDYPLLRFSRRIVPSAGRSVFDLMCDPVIDEKTLVRAFSELVASAQPQADGSLGADHDSERESRSIV